MIYGYLLFIIITITIIIIITVNLIRRLAMSLGSLGDVVHAVVLTMCPTARHQWSVLHVQEGLACSNLGAGRELSQCRVCFYTAEVMTCPDSVTKSHIIFVRTCVHIP